MPRIILFEERNRVFVFNDNGRLKVIFEHNISIFLHESRTHTRCNCGLSVENCICMNLDIVIKIKDDMPAELMSVSG